MTDLICRKTMQRCQHPGMCSPHGGCQPDKGFEVGYLDLGQFVDWVWNLKAERDQLKAENEALRKDAKRYRFLRNQHWPVAELAVVCNPKVSVKLGHDCPSGDRLDQQVDGAMIRGASHD